LKTHRISTTISQKHWALLNKYAEKYHTQQKALEISLENMEKNTDHSPPLSIEDEVWIRMGKEIKNTLMVFQKDYAKMMLETADIERFKEYTAKEKPVESIMEYYYRKPLKECSLKEIIEGIVLNIKVQNSSDSVNYTEEDGYYTINIAHSLGINLSRTSVIMHESAFKSYGVKYECKFSERSIFFKIYKN
jgi:hypothetical protein